MLSTYLRIHWSDRFIFYIKIKKLYSMLFTVIKLNFLGSEILFLFEET